MNQRTVEEVGLMLRKRIPFKRGNLTAERHGPFHRGTLSAEEYMKLLRDEPTYIVYSYGTPIGWATTLGSYVVDSAYGISPTTSRHITVTKEFL